MRRRDSWSAGSGLTDKALMMGFELVGSPDGKVIILSPVPKLAVSGPDLNGSYRLLKLRFSFRPVLLGRPHRATTLKPQFISKPGNRLVRRRVRRAGAGRVRLVRFMVHG